MLIGGFQKINSVDYPGKIACSVYVVGSNFRCPFCTTPQFVVPEEFKHHLLVPKEELFDFLSKNKKWLQGVCLKGGEPTLYEELPQFCQTIKEIGYPIKLDTNGSNPLILKKLVIKGLVDYISLEINAPKEKYEKFTGFEDSPHNYLLSKIEETITFLKRGDVEYEFKTVLAPRVVTKEDVLKIVQWIKPAKKYVLENFNPEQRTVDPFFQKVAPYSKDFIFSLKELALPFFDAVEVRY